MFGLFEQVTRVFSSKPALHNED